MPANWNYLRYCRIEMPLAFPYHGRVTQACDRVRMVSESLTGVFGFYRQLVALQRAADGYAPGLYYANLSASVFELVEAFDGSVISGTVSFDHQGTADGRSRVRICWGARLLEDVTVDSLVTGAGTHHHVAMYFESDPAYVSGTSGGTPRYGFAESARIGRLGGKVYGEPDEDGNSASKGGRHYDWDDWYGYQHGVVTTGGQSNYLNARRGIWAAVLHFSNHLREAGGLVWADGVTSATATPAAGSDYVQVYIWGEKTAGSAISAVTDRAYRTKLARANDTGSKILFRRVERPAERATYGPEVTVYTGADCRHPSLAAYDEGVITCWYMDGDAQQASLSTNDGHTWSELSNMMGSGLRNVAVTQHHGITLGVGVSNGNLYFVRSNDQGRTQDSQPGGAGARQLIGACSDDCRPCLCWYPDGEVAVWAEDDEGEPITFTNSNSGYGAWSKV